MKTKLLLPILFLFFPFQIFAQRHYNLPRVKVKVVKPFDEDRPLNNPGISIANIPVTEIPVDIEKTLFTSKTVEEVNINESGEQIIVAKKNIQVRSKNIVNVQSKKNWQPSSAPGKLQKKKMDYKPSETKQVMMGGFTCAVFVTSLVIGVLGVLFFILSAASAVSIYLIQPFMAMGLAFFGVGLAGVFLSVLFGECWFS